MKLSLNKGDSIKEKNGTWIFEILATTDGAYLISRNGKTWLTDQEILDNYVLPKEEVWKPNRGNIYWFVSTRAELTQDVWSDSSAIDNERFEFGNVFSSYKEAEEARDKVKELLLSLRKQI